MTLPNYHHPCYTAERTKSTASSHVRHSRQVVGRDRGPHDISNGVDQVRFLYQRGRIVELEEIVRDVEEVGNTRHCGLEGLGVCRVARDGSLGDEVSDPIPTASFEFAVEPPPRPRIRAPELASRQRRGKQKRLHLARLEFLQPAMVGATPSFEAEACCV